ncbi:uncharacterized protein TNCV_5000561 [Trichonephila clavipes]|nr:uncharacterized protein TNCV_5000561 [Trichonephila clavipes]
MIACFVEGNQDNWDRFLHEFSFALRTAFNKTAGKTPAELFLGRKIITPFRKLVLGTDGAEYVGGNIEKLFDEARQNMQRQHKYIIENGELLTAKGRRVTVTFDKVRIYHPRYSETSSYDTINETTYDGKELSNWSNRSNSEKSRRSRKPSGSSNQGQTRRSNPPHQQSSRKTRMEADRNGITRRSTHRGHSAAEGRLVRSRRKPTVRLCPYYLRSRFSMGIDSLPQNSLRRRSLSVEALDGDPADRST